MAGSFLLSLMLAYLFPLPHSVLIAQQRRKAAATNFPLRFARCFARRFALFLTAFRAASACLDEDSRAPTHASGQGGRRSPGRSSLPQAAALATRDTFPAACAAPPKSWPLLVRPHGQCCGSPLAPPPQAP